MTTRALERTSIPILWITSSWTASGAIHFGLLVASASRRIASKLCASIRRSWARRNTLADRFATHQRSDRVANVVLRALVLIVAWQRLELTRLAAWFIGTFGALFDAASHTATGTAEVLAATSARRRIGRIDFELEAVGALCHQRIALALALAVVGDEVLRRAAHRQALAGALLLWIRHTTIRAFNLSTITLARAWIDERTRAAQTFIALAFSFGRIPTSLWHSASLTGRLWRWALATTLRISWRTIARTNWALARAILLKFLWWSASNGTAFAAARLQTILNNQINHATTDTCFRTSGNDTSKQESIVFSIFV